jgi:hypothetical protein
MIHQRMGTYRAKTSSVKQLGGREVTEEAGGGHRGDQWPPWLQGEKHRERESIAQRPQRSQRGIGFVAKSWSVNTVAFRARNAEKPKASHRGHRGHRGGLAWWLKADR